MSVRQRRARQNGASKMESDVMGAQVMTDLYPGGASYTRTAREWWWISGQHPTPTVQQFLFGGFMELLGTALLAIIVTLVRSLAVGGNPILNGLTVGIAYAGTHYFVHMWPNNLNMRRHLNWAVSLAYFITNQIGFVGFLIYAAIQTLGAFLGGIFISGLPTSLIPGVTFPLPTTVVSSLFYVLALEGLGSLVIVFAMLAGEYYATPSEESALEENYQRGARLSALAILVLCTAFYSVQTYTFSNVVYLGGLFAGLNQGGARYISAAGALSDTTLYPGTIFTAGGAWAHYLLTPLVGGALAGLLFLFWFMLYTSRNTRLGYEVAPPAFREKEVEEPAPAASYLQHVAPAAVQTRVADLSHPYQRMH